MSEAKTDAWMPLWIGAYLADTMRLSTVQHGAYLLLLMAYWRDGQALPDDDEELRAITKCERAEWKRVRPVLQKFFVVGEGVWWHKRVEQELAGSKQRAEKASSKAKAGAQARWKHPNSDAPSNAPSIAQAMPQSMLEQCPTSHTIGIGIQPYVAKDKNSVCVESEHTQMSDEFKIHIRTARPELDSELVFANFVSHYPPEKRTFAKWQQWVANERTGVAEAAQVAAQDPETRPNVEKRGIAVGIGKWDDGREQWPQYKARVVAAERQAVAA